MDDPLPSILLSAGMSEPSSNIIGVIVLQIALILLNALFASAEIAIISMNDAKLQKMAESGDKKAIRLVRLTEQPARFLSTIQVGITLAGFLGSAFAAGNFSGPLVRWLVSLGVAIPLNVLNTLAVIFITLILSYFTLVFGELVPKRIAMKKAEAIAMGLSGFVYAIYQMTRPVVSFLTFSTNAVLKLFRINPAEEDEEVTEEEIRMMVDIGSRKGTIAPEEKDLIDNIFEFDQTSADEVMTHRTDLHVLWEEDTLGEWEETIKKGDYSRFLVCGESIDDVLGLITAKDFYVRLRDGVTETADMMKSLKNPYFVPETVKTDVLLRNMQKENVQMAVITDEYGGISGIVTMNDILEELVGFLGSDNVEEIVAQTEVIPLSENMWRVRGTILLDELSDALLVEIPPMEDYDTLGGLIFDMLGRIPEDGEAIPPLQVGSLEIVIESIANRRIEWTIVTKLPQSDAAKPSDEKPAQSAKL